MNERITCVTLFDDASIEKIKSLIEGLPKPLCKVPYGKNVADRFLADTLPYHFTLCAWDIARKEKVIEALKEMEFPTFKILVEEVSVLSGSEDSLMLLLHIARNETLDKMQSFLYERVPVEHYNPDHFQFHITIHCDQDHAKILEMKDFLKEKFSPFELEVCKFGLFEIYPASFILEIPSTQ